jgi:hypothetical protein
MFLFLSILQTVLLILIAAGIAYLIYRSPASAAVGTRKSLHARRCEVYNDVMQVLTMLGKRGEIRKEELLDFRSRTRDAALLFDGDVAAYLDEIYSRGVKLMSTNELLQGTSVAVGEERDRVTVEHTRQLIWLADQLAVIKKKFARYPDVQSSCEYQV